MWRLWNALFGWHYVGYFYGGTVSIGRLIVLPSGLVVIYMCCVGYVPIDKAGREIWPLTMTKKELKELQK